MRRNGQYPTRLVKQRQRPKEAIDNLPENLHPVLRRIFASRNLNADSIDLSLKNLAPVGLLKNIDLAAERFLKAYKDQQKVIVVGDFDADGATATALMIKCLNEFGFNKPSYEVPDRQKFGYGLTEAIVELVASQSPDLIVTVDNGVSSHAGIDLANKLGIDVIVTDHHLPGEDLPSADVIVNPNVADCNFPSKNLAGVGVAFYVMAALGKRLSESKYIENELAINTCTSCLDLVALGTVADLVPLDQNNRILIKHGLQRICNQKTRPGIEALFKVSGKNINSAVANDLGFSIAPRLNAAGRLDDMAVGIECLLSEDPALASKLSNVLNQLNKERRELQEGMQQDAEAYLEKLKLNHQSVNKSAVCLFDTEWHSGVVGLVASRVKEIMNRPVVAFAFSGEDEEIKGSGRSVAGIHIRDVLANIDASYPGLIKKFGGHAMAAGLSLDRGRLEDFSHAFEAEVEKYKEFIDDSGLLLTDGLLDARYLNLDFAELLRNSGPWGQGFAEPIFEGVFKVINQRIVGGKHLKLLLQLKNLATPVDAIFFNNGSLLEDSDKKLFLVVYRLDINEFRQTRSHQLVVEHIESV
ncbi:MAG: single-stranded-DNA-specific exonuclease RecJ [Pseudomonadota bacterium]|nr:single-stranded-DNA-specific exonuclease RecJ [Pseudomonadota bacterium]